MDKRYLVYKKVNSIFCMIDYDKLDGYLFLPQNEKEYYGITVSKINLINKELIKDVLKRKIKKKLNIYLNLIMSMYDEDDEWNDPALLSHALNEVQRFISMIKNKYRKYLEEKYVSILLAKLALIEKELKERIDYLQYRLHEEMLEEHKKSR